MADGVYPRVREFTDPLRLLGESLPGEIENVTEVAPGVFAGVHPEYGQMIRYDETGWRQPNFKQLQTLQEHLQDPMEGKEPLGLPVETGPAEPAFMRDAVVGLPEPVATPDEDFSDPTGAEFWDMEEEVPVIKETKDGAEPEKPPVEPELDVLLAFSDTAPSHADTRLPEDQELPASHEFTGLTPEDFSDPTSTMELFDPIAKKYAEERAKAFRDAPGYGEVISSAWEEGQKQLQMGRLGTQWQDEFDATGEEPQHIIDQIRQIEASMGEDIDHPGVLRDLLESTTKFLPIMWEGTKQGQKAGLAGASGGAVIGSAAAGVGAGPGALTGYIGGASYGAAESIYQIVRGLSYAELRKEPDMGPTIASYAASTIGLFEALLETAQIGTLLKTLPGAKAVIRKATNEAVVKTLTSKAGKDTLKRMATKYATFVGTETGQELAQEASQITWEILAKELNNHVKDTNIDPKYEDIMGRMVEVGMESLKGFILMGVPGQVTTAFTAGKEKVQDKVRQSRQQKQMRQAIDKLVSYLETVDEAEPVRETKVQREVKASKDVAGGPTRTVESLKPKTMVEGTDIRFDGYQQTIKDGKIVDDQAMQMTVQEGELKGATFNVMKDKIDELGLDAAIDERLADLSTQRKLKAPVTVSDLSVTEKAPGVTEPEALVTKPVRDFHRDLRADIADKVRANVLKVAAYKGWKFQPGDRVKGSVPGKAYEIIGQSFSQNKPVYFYKSVDGTEKGMFNADKAHESMTKFEGPKEVKFDKGDVEGGVYTKEGRISGVEAPVAAGLYRPAIRVDGNVHAMRPGTETTHFQIMQQPGVADAVLEADANGLADGFIDVNTKEFYTRRELADKIAKERPELMARIGNVGDLIGLKIQQGHAETMALHEQGLIKWAKATRGESSADGAATIEVSTYAEGMAAGNKTNVLVKKKGSKSKYLILQISAKEGTDGDSTVGADNPKASKFYDDLYDRREGYSRPDDFWEIPEWAAMAAHTIPDADFYVVRNQAQAEEFLANGGYEAVFMSAMDANKAQVKELAASHKGKNIVGGYVEASTFKGMKNVLFLEDLSAAAKALGVPYRDGFDYSMFKGTKTIPRLELSRGCKHNCAFCTVEGGVTERGKAGVDQQIEAFRDLDFELVYLNDKTFGQAKNYEQLSEINDKIKAFNPNFKGFVVQTTAPTFNKMDDAWLEKSGIAFVELGVESFNDDILKKVKKPHTTAMIEEAAQKIRAHGMQLIPNIIVGLAGKQGPSAVWTETKETYQNTLDFLDRNQDIISHPNVYVLATYKGTELERQLQGDEVTDANENMIEKSWLKDRAVHESFYDSVLSFGSKQLGLSPSKRRANVTKIAEGHKAEIEKSLAPLIKSAQNAAKTVVHATEEEVPDESLRSKVKLEKDLGRKVFAWFDPASDEVHMIASNIATEDAAIHWMHEQVGHRGLKEVFGENKLVDEFLLQIYPLLREKDAYYMDAVAKSYDADLSTDAGKIVAAEEVFANRAGHLDLRRDSSIWKAFKAFLKKFLDSVIGKGKYTLTDKDVDLVLQAAKEFVFKGKNDGGRGTITGDMVKWDFDEIVAAAGGRYGNVGAYLRENGWKGSKLPESAITYAEGIAAYDAKKRKYWKGIRQFRKDMQTGKIEEGTRAYDRGVRKYGSDIEGFTIRHARPFQVGLNSIYGPKGKDDREIIVTVNHPTLGQFKVKRYVDPQGRLVHDLPIFSTDPVKRASEIDKLIQDNKQHWRWYDDWNEWMRQFEDKGVAPELITKYIKIQAILSGQTGPQSNQKKFTDVVGWLEKNHAFENRNYTIKADGIGISKDDARKVTEIWQDEIMLDTLSEMRARYGRKVGTYMYTGLNPQHSKAIVIDRHMGRAFGYDLGWIANRGSKYENGRVKNEGFKVKPIVEYEITKEILEAANRAGISAGAAQAALWFAMRPEDVEASSYREAGSISPGYLPGVMLDATQRKENWAKHYGPDDINFIIGSPLHGHHGTYSETDVGQRKVQTTERHPYVDYSYFYNTGARPEVAVRSRSQGVYAISLKGLKIYDLDADLMGLHELANELTASDKGSHRGNVIAKLIKDRDFDGMSTTVNVRGDRWTNLFYPQPALPSVTTTVRMSDAVESIADYPQDVEALEKQGDKKRPKLIKELKALIASKYQEVRLMKNFTTVARFGSDGEGATSGKMEDGLTLELSGPLPSIRSLLSEWVGLGKSQRMVFIQYDPAFYAMEKEATSKLKRAVPTLPKSLLNGVRFKFPAKRGITAAQIQDAFETAGMQDFNITKSESGFLYVDQFIGNWESDLVDAFEALYGEIGQPGRLEHYQTYSETLGDLDGDLVKSYTNYRKHIEGWFGKEKGGDYYGAAVEKGEVHKRDVEAAQAEQGSKASEGRDGDDILQPEDEPPIKFAKAVGQTQTLAYKISDMAVTGDTKVVTVMEVADAGTTAYEVAGTKVKSRPGVRPKKTLKEVAPGQVKGLVKEAGTKATKITTEMYQGVVKQLKEQHRQELRAGKDEAAAVTAMRLRAVHAGWKSRQKTAAETRKIIAALKKAYKRVPKLSDPIKEGVQALLDGVDFSKPTAKTLLKLNRIRDYLSQHPEAEIPEGVLESLGRLDKTPARDMTMNDLRDLFMAVKNLLHIEATKNRIKMNRRLRSLERAVEEGISQFRPAKDVKNELYHEASRWQKLGDMAEWVVEAFGLNSFHFDWLIEKMAGPNSVIDSVVNKGVKAGVLEKDIVEEESFRLFRDKLVEKGLIDRKGQGLRLKDLKGKQVKSILDWLYERVPTPGSVGGKMLRTNRMAIYMLSLSPDNRRHLLEGGYGVKYTSRGKIWKHADRTMQMNEATLAEIVNSMTEEEEDFAMASQEVFDYLWPKTSDVYYEKNGYRPQKVSGVYWPIKVQPVSLGANEEADSALEMFKGRFTRPGAPKGHTKSRVKSKKPLYIIPFDTMLAESIRKSSTYIGLEMPMTHASRLLFGPKGLEAAIRDRYGAKWFQAIEQGLRDIVGEYKTYDEVETWFRKWKNRFVTSVLGINPWVVAKQPLSYALFNAYVDVEWMALGFAQYALNPKRIWDLNKKYSVQRRTRGETGPDREIADIFKGKTKKRLWGGGKGFQEKVMVGIKGADLLAVDPGMHGAVLFAMHRMSRNNLTAKMKEVLDMENADIPSTTEERMVLAYKFADHAVEHTQPMFSPMHRSAWSRGGTFAQTFTMFTSFTNMAYNLLHRVTDEAIRRPSNESIRKAASVYTSLLVLNPVGIMLLDSLRDRVYDRADDDDGWVSWLKWMRSLGGYLYVVRDIIGGIVGKMEGKWGDYRHPAGEPIQKAIDVGANLAKALTAEEEWKRNKHAVKFADDAAELAAMGLGIPYTTPKQLVKTGARLLDKGKDESGGF